MIQENTSYHRNMENAAMLFKIFQLKIPYLTNVPKIEKHIKPAFISVGGNISLYEENKQDELMGLLSILQPSAFFYLDANFEHICKKLPKQKTVINADKDIHAPLHHMCKKKIEVLSLLHGHSLKTVTSPQYKYMQSMKNRLEALERKKTSKIEVKEGQMGLIALLDDCYHPAVLLKNNKVVYCNKFVTDYIGLAGKDVFGLDIYYAVSLGILKWGEDKAANDYSL